ncbi:AAA+ ATPase domain [Macleaya cordata]|uniref:AAA+ ATPase domain n=1 Tax=Macleaya cordata TaxID=56857 RepID=A0A200QRF7_MACCD|nr:AAA+ ATPase domain [Macleaya cordata]
MDFLMDWKSMGSLFATIMFIRTAVRDFLPPEVNQALKRFFSYIFNYLQPKLVTILIEEFDNSYNNELYDSVQCYLSSKCFSSAQVLKLSKPKNSKNLTFTMDTNQSFEDNFDGFKLNWSFHTVEKKTSDLGFSRSHENRYFQLSFHTRFKDMVHSSYLPHIIKEAEIIKFKNRERKLYTNRSADENGRLWSSVPFTHPSTFDTVAIDPILKKEIKDDLMKFVNRRDFYTRVGRAWKRGYLLYGPPGTGKTSLIASIANFLEFDIYDLELTAVSSNSQLRKLLISTTSKSVIVVEDIDCSLDLSDRKKKDMNREDDKMNVNKIKNGQYSTFGSSVSLSGVLNFVDGLWSSCGGERLIIFTTNHKEKLDVALLRPGRMDKHINLSFCDTESFKILMRNYLEIEEHEIMKEVEEMLGLVKMTPADVAEIFMSCDEDVDMGMRNVVEEMKKRLRSIKEESKEEMKKDVEEDLIIEEKFEKEEEDA